MFSNTKLIYKIIFKYYSFFLNSVFTQIVEDKEVIVVIDGKGTCSVSPFSPGSILCLQMLHRSICSRAR